MNIHIPVMLKEAMEGLDVAPYRSYIDATFGRGGYSKAILTVENTNLLAIDQDLESEHAAHSLKAQFGERFIFKLGNFQDLKELYPPTFLPPSGIVFDLGVSSPQIDSPERGFSLRADGPLDMRMSGAGATASDFLNTLCYEELRDVFYYYGEEKRAGHVARLVLQNRPLYRTSELRAIVAQALGPDIPGQLPKATRIFQALRILVNDELGVLQRSLHAAADILSLGGRLVVVSFHSLEDRLVKKFLAESFLENLTLKPLTPTPAEIALNPRAKSARLRIAYKPRRES